MFSFPVFYVFSIHVFIVAVSFLVILLLSLPYWRNLEESSIVYLYSHSAPFPVLFSSSRDNLSVSYTLALKYILVHLSVIAQVPLPAGSFLRAVTFGCV